MGIISPNRGKNKTCFKPPPRESDWNIKKKTNQKSDKKISSVAISWSSDASAQMWHWNLPSEPWTTTRGCDQRFGGVKFGVIGFMKMHPFRMFAPNKGYIYIITYKSYVNKENRYVL